MNAERGELGRREFLTHIGLIAAATGATLTANPAAGQNANDKAPQLPTIKIGDKSLTRLVAGWNPIGGHSYLGPNMDRHMKEYFTVDQTVEFLFSCERAGMNTHQFSGAATTAEVLQKARDRGANMNFFGLHADRKQVAAFANETKPFALAHHGGVTDHLFREGKKQEVHDYVKQVHDQGLLAGVSAHNPNCIRQIADEDWEVDFFMCCFYHLTRKSTDAGCTTFPPETLQIAYPFYKKDPAIMTSVMRQVDQPCFGFKILGAGRSCASQATVKNAFKFAFNNIKPNDGVIVGMYPRFFDEVSANSKYTRELT